MTPLQRYQAHLQSGKIKEDPTQHEIVTHFDKLAKQLTNKESLFSRLLSHTYRNVGIKQIPPEGIYLWGGVGRGKTFLMDLFFHALPFKQKTRMHFHRFMNYVHHAMHVHQGAKDPLRIIAREFAERSIVLCFDELHVSDIADAMILAELFLHLFEQGVTLVATSNIPPEGLYPNGLQRDKFLPTIALINTYTQVIEIKGALDYRLQSLSQSQIYHYPLSAQVQSSMQEYFNRAAHERENGNGDGDTVLFINDRPISVINSADGVVWFTFEALCKTARSAMDYIEIAKCYHTVLLSDVPAMGTQQDDAALRFISLVDEFYDHQVKLIISAEVPLSQLYQGERHAFEFQRTVSRLTEMQASTYLSKPHIP